jgi:hypothetical protein
MKLLFIGILIYSCLRNLDSQVIEYVPSVCFYNDDPTSYFSLDIWAFYCNDSLPWRNFGIVFQEVWDIYLPLFILYKPIKVQIINNIKRSAFIIRTRKIMPKFGNANRNVLTVKVFSGSNEFILTGLLIRT